MSLSPSRRRFRARNRRAQLDVSRLEARQLLATIVVTSAGDEVANDGFVTLREAIEAANTNADPSGDTTPGDAGLDTIEFNIAGGGLQTITPTSQLPTIIEPVIINGYTQPESVPNSDPNGNNAVLRIELNGADAGFSGLVIEAGGSTIRGLAINDFNRAIQITSLGGNLIAGNFIGTNATGDAAESNAVGIEILAGANIVGGVVAADRNLISGNTSDGIALSSAASGTLIQGNFIGTNAAGTAALANGTNGVTITAGSHTVGGTATGAGNVISGNTTGGIDISTTGNLIEANFIGTGPGGAGALGNGAFGINLSGTSANNTIGGTVAGSANVIANTGASGNGAGVQSAGTGNSILGNAIFDNTGMGIFRSDATPTPVLTTVTATTIEGTLTGTASTTYRVEFFSTPDAGQTGDAQRQGQTFLGFVDVTTDAGGNATLSFDPSGGVPASEFITATATDSPSGTTSPFSDAVLNSSPSTADLALTIDDSPDPVAPGQNITYTINVINNGLLDAANAELTIDVPANTTFQSFTGPGDWTVTTPSVGGTGTVTATTTLFGNAATASFTLVVQVDAGAADGTVISASPNISSDTTDDDLTNNGETETTTVTTQGSDTTDVAVTIDDSPDPVAPGENITYTINANNIGTLDATNAILTIDVPANTTFVSFTSPGDWTVTTPSVGGTGTITATNATFVSGGSAAFTLVVQVDGAVADGTVINATATIGSDTGDSDTTNNSDTETTTVTTQGTDEADLALTIDDSPDPVLAGQNITYTINVTNNGAIDAANAALTIDVPADTTFVSFTAPGDWTVTAPAVGGTGTITATNSTLAAGASAPFTLVVQVNADVTNGTTISATANAATDTTDGDETNNTDTETTVVGDTATEADLHVTLTDNPDPAAAGGTLSYTINVTNNGASDAANATLTIDVPASTTFQSFTAPAGWSVTSPNVGETGTITAIAPSFANGASALFTLVTQVDAGLANGTTLSATATVSSDATDPLPDDNSITETTTIMDAETTADVSITKTASPSAVSPNTDLTYTLVVSNAGPNAAAGVSIADTLPANTTFVSATGGVTPVGGVVTFDAGSLASGQTATFQIIVRPTGAVGSTVTNTASVTTSSFDPNTANNTATSTITLQPAQNNDLAIAIASSPDPVAPGGTLTYTVTLTGDASGNTTVSIPLPAQTTFTSFSAPAGFTVNAPSVGGTGTVTATSTSTSGTQTFTLLVRVNDGIPSGTSLTTTASVTNDAGTDPNSSNNSASDSTTVQAVNDTSPPFIIDVVRYGFHTQSTLLVVSFSEAMNAALAGDPNNYVVLLPGADGTLETGDDIILSIAQAFYDPSTFQTTLRVSQRVYAFNPFQLGILSGALLDAAGNALDGDFDGVAGGDSVTTLDIASIAGTAIEAPNADQVGAVNGGPLAVTGLKKNGRIQKAKLARAKAAQKAQQVAIQTAAQKRKNVAQKAKSTQVAAQTKKKSAIKRQKAVATVSIDMQPVSKRGQGLALKRLLRRLSARA